VDYDSLHHRLFVGDTGRLYVFDVAPQELQDFPGAKIVWRSRPGEGNPITMGVGLVDSKNQRLFVNQGSNNRILVFDIRPEAFSAASEPVAVLGQPDFASTAPGIGPDRLAGPAEMAYDDRHDRLFVTDAGNFRFLVFDGRDIRTGVSAIAVLGQDDFHSRERHDPLDFTRIQPGGRQMTYDPATDRLFVVTGGAGIADNRVAVYDAAPERMKNFPDLIAVIGKPGEGRYDAVVDEVNVMWPGVGAHSVDSDNQLLYVMEGHGGGNRISIFDVHPERLRSGQPAVGVIGHIGDDGEPSFTRRSPSDRANDVNFYPRDTALDTVDHRLFATDQYQERILGFQLDPMNRVLDYRASIVVGQPDFFGGEMRPTSARTVKTPFALAYDERHKRLFAMDSWANRVLVFDADPRRLQNYPAAIAVIGQRDFVSFEEGTTERAIFADLRRTSGGITPGGSRAAGLAYDRAHDRLFVADGGNSRVLVFDVAPERLENYPAAIRVLGQPDFTSGRTVQPESEDGNAALSVPRAAVSARSFGNQRPGGMTYDEKHQRLFVSDGQNHRVLVFDARPERLTNGADAIAVIGQPDFSSHQSGRSDRQLNGPDGIAYDYARDRIYVSDHENNRVLVFDAAPDRLGNGPSAVAVLGQKDFESLHRRGRTGFGGSGVRFIYDPRGLAFDSENRRLYQASGAATNLMIWDMPRAVREVAIPGRSTVRLDSLGVRERGESSPDSDRAGYAVVDSDAPLGLVSSLIAGRDVLDETRGERASRLLMSQIFAPGVRASREVVFYRDQRSGSDTALSIVNPGPGSARLKLTLRDSSGRTTAASGREVQASAQLALRTSELSGAEEVGTISMESSQPVYAAAVGSSTNERGERLFRPVAFSREGRGGGGGRAAIAGLVDGGGFRSEIALMNPGGHEIAGRIRYLSQQGDVRRTDGFRIPASGVFLWTTEGAAPQPEKGFAIVEATEAGPVASGTVYFRKGGALVSARGLSPAAVYSDQEAQLVWFPVDTVPSLLRSGRIRQLVTVANPEPIRQVDVRFSLTDAFGKEIGLYEIVVLPQSQQSFDIAELFDRTRFARASLKVLTDLPVGIDSHQEITTVRDEVVEVGVSGVNERDMGSGPWLVTDFLDRGEVATQVHLINPRKEASRGTISFFTPEGKPMSVTLR
jgi:DNA-binding beta-propeller fold protein YncE